MPSPCLESLCGCSICGLYLEVSETGRRWWRLKYRFAGKEKRLSLGVCPETSLKEARECCDEARKLLGAGVDPSQQRQADRLARAVRSENTFEKIGLEWYGKHSEVWVPEHAARVLSRLERDIFPFLDERPITAIEMPELFGVLRRIESRGVRETVRRARQDCDQIFAFVIAAGRCQRNPAAALSKAFAPKKKTVQFPAITDPRKFGELLRTMDGTARSKRNGGGKALLLKLSASSSRVFIGCCKIAESLSEILSIALNIV